MKLLYVCADDGIPLDGNKGASVHVRQTIEALGRRGVDVTVLAARPGREGAVPGRVLPGAPPRGSGEAPLAHELGAIAAARDLASRVPLAPGDVDLIYERYSLWSLAGALLGERLAAPLVLEVNAPLVEEQARYRALSLVGLASEIERHLARNARAVLCVSSSLCARIAKLRGSADEVHLVPNSVDTDRFRPQEGAASPGAPREARDLTVIFVGSLKPWHGLPGLLEAFSRVPEGGRGARLVIVGEGRERPALERLTAELGVSTRVTFAGAVPHEEVPALLAAADIAVAPAPDLADFYFSPLKLGEYLAAGLPVIAAACGDLAGLLRDGESALLVPPGDIAALARALGSLLSDPVLRRRLGEGGRRVAVERLSLEASTGRLTRLLEEIHAEASGALRAGGRRS